MNISNKLTILRIILAFICIGLTLTGKLFAVSLALSFFIIASVTDYLDGYLARKHHLISDLGKLLDPIADKILVIGVFIAFVELEIVSPWIIVAIILRESIITGLRLYSLNKGTVLEARVLGKHKTASQVGAIFFIFIMLILFRLYPTSQIISFFYYQGITIVMWYVLIITLFSGVHYFWVNRKIVTTF